jgi:hypothetical protein
MKIMTVIPKSPYLLLVARLEPKSPEYLMLKNGFIEHTEDGEVVEIPCDVELAKTIIDLVSRVAPELLSSIKQISLAPDL